MYLFNREREGERTSTPKWRQEGEREREFKAGSTLSIEPNLGLEYDLS